MLSVTISLSETTWCSTEGTAAKKGFSEISNFPHVSYKHQDPHPHEEQETTIMVFVWLVPALTPQQTSGAAAEQDGGITEMRHSMP